MLFSCNLRTFVTRQLIFFLLKIRLSTCPTCMCCSALLHIFRCSDWFEFYPVVSRATLISAHWISKMSLEEPDQLANIIWSGRLGKQICSSGIFLILMLSRHIWRYSWCWENPRTSKVNIFLILRLDELIKYVCIVVLMLHVFLANKLLIARIHFLQNKQHQ